MRLLIIGIFSIFLFTGCHHSTQDKTSSNSSENKGSISYRHMQDNKWGDAKYSSEQEWDSLNDVSTKTNQLKKGKIDPEYRSFGWHFFSSGSTYKNYNFDMLWGISYFSYSIVPETGSYKSIHQWKTTALIDSAKIHNCKIFLSVSICGAKKNDIFLKNKKAQQNLIDSLTYLLALRNADGINFDFEGISQKTKAAFTKFMTMISSKLKQSNPNYMVSLCLYADDWDHVFDIEALNPYIDFYTLMGYDYYGSFSKNTGPVTPLKNSKLFGNGLESSVKSYLNKGVQAKDLIVGLPYYGAEWYTESPEKGAKVKNFISHLPYKNIRRIYIDSLNLPLQFDSLSASSYMFVKDENAAYRQIWFEDVNSLSLKYDWIKTNKLGGVGIWALGYDDGYTELWDLLTEKFSIK